MSTRNVYYSDGQNNKPLPSTHGIPGRQSHAKNCAGALANVKYMLDSKRLGLNPADYNKNPSCYDKGQAGFIVELQKKSYGGRTRSKSRGRTRSKSRGRTRSKSRGRTRSKSRGRGKSRSIY